MLMFLVFLIVLILLFGASAVLSTVLGAIAWVIGLVAVIGFSVWFASTYDVDVGLVIFAVIFGPIAALFGSLYWSYLADNKSRNHWRKRTFAEYMKDL